MEKTKNNKETSMGWNKDKIVLSSMISKTIPPLHVVGSCVSPKSVVTPSHWCRQLPAKITSNNRWRRHPLSLNIDSNVESFQVVCAPFQSLVRCDLLHKMRLLSLGQVEPKMHTNDLREAALSVLAWAHIILSVLLHAKQHAPVHFSDVWDRSRSLDDTPHATLFYSTSW